MIRWLLDTNAIIALLKGKFPRFTSRVMAEKPETFGLSVIVYHELIYGAAKSARPEQNMQLIDAIAHVCKVESTTQDEVSVDVWRKK